MIIIPSIISIILTACVGFTLWNIFYQEYIKEIKGGEDETFHIHKYLLKQSEKLLSEEIDKTEIYKKIEKYIDKNNAYIEIYYESDLKYSFGSSKINNTILYETIMNLGGEGSICIDNINLYCEKINVDKRVYTICIYNSLEKISEKEDLFIDIIKMSIVLLVIIFVITTVFITNRFLIKFVFRKIEKPLHILIEGVNEIRNGNLDFHIEYTENDEFLLVCDDFNNMALRLKESVENTQKQELNRKELIAGISHDIRTPLTSIKAYIEGLIDGIADTPMLRQKYMRTIQQKANDIDNMVDKLFMFSKLDLGEYPFYPEKIDINNEIMKIIEENKSNYAVRGMNIVYESIPQKYIVYVDPIQLRNAVTNILENSIKYKDKDNVTVNIKCFDNNDFVTVIIEDNGPGVPEEALEKLFNVFYRADPSRNNSNKGSGLGLAITAKIMERFDGSISAENVVPNGLRIIITLPKRNGDEI